MKSAIVIGIFILISLGYIFENQRLQNNAYLENFKNQQENLKLCLFNADVVKTENWNQQCKMRDQKDYCALPISLSNRVETYYKDYKDDCFKQFPQNSR